MRLGQLSRKIGVKPSEIVSYLKDDFNHEISSHPNCKINDEFLEPTIAYFKTTDAQPSPLDAEITQVAENVITKNGEEESKVDEEPVLVTDENESAPQEHADIESPTSEESTHNIEAQEVEEIDEKPEEFYKEEADLNVVDGIIKAPKVEVEGLKVVGKIDLPEKPQEDEESENIESEKSENKDEKNTTKNDEVKNITKTEQKKPAQTRTSSHKKKNKRKETSYEEQKKRELLIYEKKREAAEKKRKELNRLNYEKLMKQKVNKTKTTSNKKSKKKTQSRPSDEVKNPVPKTLWGRFIHWLNT